MRKMQILSCVLALILVSCISSKEEKAEKLIRETLKDYLYNPDSYDPISTRVDSMFIDVSTIGSIMEISKEMAELTSKIGKCEREIESAESSMDIWSPNGYASQYSRGEYARAKEKKDEAMSNLEKYNKRLADKIIDLKDCAKKYHKGEFTGWAVLHRFNCLNGTGTMNIPGEIIFFCDEEFKTCEGCEIDKFENLVKILKVVEDAADEDEIKDFFEENMYLF